MNSENPIYKKIEWWVKLYSYITLAGIFYGIAAAHIPPMIGYPWSSCENCNCKLACVLVFHLYETPLVLYNLFFAWYGLKKFSASTIHNYSLLLTFAIVSNLAFFTFESVLLLDNIKSNSPEWESIALTSVALMLAAGAGLGIYVKQKVVSYLYKSNQD